jgi:hypothetical protein
LVTIERGGIAHYFDTLDFREVNGRWVHVPKQPGQLASVPAPDKQALLRWRALSVHDR